MLEAGYYSIITHDVLYDDNLTANEKLLYACITGLTKQKGYCYASNDYLSEKMNTSKRSVSRWLNNLEKKGYIKRKLVYKEDSKEVQERQIYTLLNGGVKNDMGYSQNSHEPHDKNDNTPHDTDGMDNSELINSQSNSKVDNNSPAKAEPSIPYKKIIDYLNQETDRQFSHVADSNRKLIKARWNELKKTHKGITEDELLNSFKTVIDNKVADAKDPKHFFDEQYLRPSTLFRGSNFDDYLNQPPRNNKTGGQDLSEYAELF